MGRTGPAVADARSKGCRKRGGCEPEKSDAAHTTTTHGVNLNNSKTIHARLCHRTCTRHRDPVSPFGLRLELCVRHVVRNPWHVDFAELDLQCMVVLKTVWIYVEHLLQRPPTAKGEKTLASL